MSVGEIAEELGFAYPNHFTRMFRRRVGISPLAYRSQHL
ncbi:MAG: helix-turn-helix domain-containing protein [Paraprevotella sp.]|nr:helix-turn-helix domain-containing protein [Paraprevotella sp.]